MNRADAVEVCLLCLHEADSPHMWRTAVWELGTLKDQRATPHLVDALHYPDWECRHYAVMALARLEDPASVPALEELLTSDYLYPDGRDPAGHLSPELAAHLHEDIAFALAKARQPGTIPDHP
jgi:HEAT repeat protein